MPDPHDLIESKVKASTVATVLASVAVAVLNGVAADSTLLGPLPAPVQAVILLLIPPLATFLAGYTTRSNRI